MIDRAKFFDGLRNQPFSGALKPETVQGITAILDEWERRGLTDLRWLAYMLATVKHECGEGMLPVREGFSDTDAKARAFVKRQGYKYAVVINGQVYYGRGLVQLTWERNYRAMTKLLNDACFGPKLLRGVTPDLVADPDRALEPDIACFIMFEGMIRGTFTGKKLADFFNDGKTDWLGARKIINGTDKAALIADIAKSFYADLVLAA